MDYNNNEYNFTTQNTQPVQPKKKGSFKKVLAGVLAVAIIGGGAGFGGAYLAGSLVNSTNAVSQSADTSAVTTTQPAPADLSSLANTEQKKTTDELSASELYKAVEQSIVKVSNYQKVSTTSTSGSGSIYDYFFGGGYGSKKETEPSIQLYGTGSGVIFTTDGYVITNYHVIQNAAKISVTVTDSVTGAEGVEMEAEVIGSDSSTDLAVLKITRDEAFVAAPIGDSSSLEIGQTVCAIGNPSGLDKTITMGIISGLNRHYSSAEGYELSSIQTDTAINPGNSGGGLFDMYGNVVGIVNAKIVSEYTESLGFAITIDEAKPIINDLINFGYVTGRPVLGVTTVQLNEYTAYLYGYSTTGLLITSINEGAPVEKSGLRLGDIITQINGTDVTTVSDVQAIIKSMKAGDTVEATVVRQSEDSSRTQTLKITIELTENRG
ncbi:MAG: S1C family serine protease [Ruminiclostridium sp.]